MTADTNPIELTEQKFQEALAGTIPLYTGSSNCPLCQANSTHHCGACPITQYPRAGCPCYGYNEFHELQALMQYPNIIEGYVVPDSPLAIHIEEIIIPALQKINEWADKEKFYE